MSYDDKNFMKRGFRVRHKYTRRRGCYGVCERCGVKRRSTSSGWEYFDPKTQPRSVPPSTKKLPARWTSSNPPCVRREQPEPSAESLKEMPEIDDTRFKRRPGRGHFAHLKFKP